MAYRFALWWWPSQLFGNKFTVWFEDEIKFGKMLHPIRLRHYWAKTVILSSVFLRSFLNVSKMSWRAVGRRSSSWRQTAWVLHRKVQWSELWEPLRYTQNSQDTQTRTLHSGRNRLTISTQWGIVCTAPLTTKATYSRPELFIHHLHLLWASVWALLERTSDREQDKLISCWYTRYFPFIYLKNYVRRYQRRKTCKEKLKLVLLYFLSSKAILGDFLWRPQKRRLNS